MIYREIPPPPDLRHLVICYWEFGLEPGDPSPMQHTIPPDGTISITWVPIPGSLILVGPRMDALRVPIVADVVYVGARLYPGAVREAIGLEALSIRGVQAPLASLAPEKAEHLIQSIAGATHDADRFAAAMNDAFRSWNCPPPDAIVATMIDRILSKEETTAKELIAGLDLSYRQALRRFRTAVGLTPKEFARLRRIRTACIHGLLDADHPNLAEISASTGFADQAHMTREFGRTFGWPPSLVMEYLRRIEHQVL